MNLETLLELAEKQAQVVLIGLRKPLIPSWVLVDAKNRAKIFGTPWQDNSEKDLDIRKEIQEWHAVAYSFVGEGWFAYQPQGWSPEQGVDVPVMKRPDRQECVIALATNGKETKWRRWLMIRDHLEQVVKLEPVSTEGQMESWFTDLLSDG